MRIKRTEKFKKYDSARRNRLLIYALILPCASVFLGYLLTVLLILPAMKK